MSISIVGAGLAGLLAGNMLKHHDPTIYETQSSLPNNHSAVLRFRTPIIGDIMNIPFKKVTLIKAVVSWLNPAADALAYSFKNSGEYRSDRSIINGEAVADRYIAPPDLIPRMAEHLDITYDTRFGFDTRLHPTISTIPMPALMKALDYKQTVMFEYVDGFNVSATIKNCDAYIGVSVPDPKYKFSRISITGSQMIVEIPNQKTIDEYSEATYAAAFLGINPSDLTDIDVKKQQYSKILPIPEEARRDFIYWATNEHNVYSLGRFATWRPGLLMDSLVQDVRLIDGWISRNDRYSRFRKK